MRVPVTTVIFTEYADMIRSSYTTLRELSSSGPTCSPQPFSPEIGGSCSGLPRHHLCPCRV